jgi:hypothetical protein
LVCWASSPSKAIIGDTWSLYHYLFLCQEIYPVWALRFAVVAVVAVLVIETVEKEMIFSLAMREFQLSKE